MHSLQRCLTEVHKAWIIAFLHFFVERIAYKFAHGPNNWLHGSAFFSACKEIGFKGIRCPWSHLMSIFLSTGASFMGHCATKKKELEDVLYDQHVSAADINMFHANAIMDTCPYIAYSNLFSNPIIAPIFRERDRFHNPLRKDNRLFDLLFDARHPPESLLNRALESFLGRWHKLFPCRGGQLKLLVRNNLIQNLSLIGKQLPPRIHNACLRFILNGFHTARRYQEKQLCLFCKKEGCFDSIEHFTECEVLLGLLPFYFKQQQQITRNKHWFLLTSKTDSTLFFAMFIAAVYTVHNSLRHFSDTRELRQQFQRVYHFGFLSTHCRRLWDKVFR